MKKKKGQFNSSEKPLSYFTYILWKKSFFRNYLWKIFFAIYFTKQRNIGFIVVFKLFFHSFFFSFDISFNSKKFAAVVGVCLNEE